MAQLFRHCPDCGGDRLFELLHELPGGCSDSPDGDCPEWSCTACGAALLIGVVPAGRESVPAGRESVPAGREPVPAREPVLAGRSAMAGPPRSRVA